MDTEKVTETLSTGSLDQIIQQSKENLAEAALPKRGRGRPPGTFKVKNKPENEANSDEFRKVEGVVLKENEIEPLSMELVRAPFDLFGWKNGIDLTPTEDEAKAPTKYLSKLIECYLPDLDAKDPKKFNFIALVISYSLLILKKFRVFAKSERDKKNQKNNEPPVKGESPAKPEEPVSPSAPQRPLPKDSEPIAGAFNRGGIR